MRTFKGFSTINRQYGNFKLYDKELALRDLLNELYTRKGERLMSPSYGSIVWDLLFDPLIDAVIEAITDDCRRIVDKDPRLELIQVLVTESVDQQSVQVTLVLRYLPTSTVEELVATFNRNTDIERTEG
jgi:phage baseplate assembly protein W